MKHPIKCFITDDEEHAADTIKAYVEQTPSLQLVGMAFSGVETLDFLGKNEVDLLFLDVQMPGLSGLDVLGITKVPVMLTTAYREYAVDGFEHEVIDYLLKPVSYQRFLKAIQRAITLLNKPLAGTTNAVPNPAAVEKDYLFVKGDRSIQIKINHSDIDYIEGAKNYVCFHCNKTKHVTKMTLKEVESLLPPSLFIRIHNSFIIAIKKIISVNGNEVLLSCRDQGHSINLPIGQGFKPQFMDKIDI